MKSHSQTQIGAACISVFVIGSAFRDVYLGHIFQSVSVFLVLLVAFGMATAAGLVLSLAKGERLDFIWRAPGDVVWMNLATAGAWLCYFLALKWLDPSIVNTLFAGIGPFAIIALNVCGVSITAPDASSPLQKMLQLGVVGSLAALVGIVVVNGSGVQGVHPALALAGAGLALLAGSLITIGHLYAKRLNDRGCSPEAIIGTRFVALLIVASVAITGEGPDAVVAASASEMARIAGAAALLIVVPVFFNQVGMAKISPLAARVMTAGGPVLVFMLQRFDPRIEWSNATFAAILAYSSFVIAANLVHGRLWNVRRLMPA